MKYYDISPVIDEKTPVFPGDKAFERDISMDFSKGDHLGLSAITTTVHIGAHTDAPNHYHRDGQAIHERSLEYYLGACQVIDVQKVGARRILREDIGDVKIAAPRVLFKSLSFLHDQPFQTAFTSLSAELIDHLAAQGVKLVGIDTPSVDPSDSKDLPSHAALYRNNLAVLEGIDLGSVPEGLYTLVALPLPLRGADASPVRAVLLPNA